MKPQDMANFELLARLDIKEKQVTITRVKSLKVEARFNFTRVLIIDQPIN